MQKYAKPVVLVVEDDPNDLMLLRLVARRSNPSFTLEIAHDGDQAIAYLASQSEFAKSKSYLMPDVILLDLHLPKKDGFEVLEWIRGRPQFNELPVFAWTGSEDPEHKKRAIMAGANGVIVKTTAFGQFEAVIKRLNQAVRERPPSQEILAYAAS